MAKRRPIRDAIVFGTVFALGVWSDQRTHANAIAMGAAFGALCLLWRMVAISIVDALTAVRKPRDPPQGPWG